MITANLRLQLSITHYACKWPSFSYFCNQSGVARSVQGEAVVLETTASEMGLDSSQISKPSDPVDPDDLELSDIANQITALAEDSDTEAPSSGRSVTAAAADNKQEVEMSSAGAEQPEGGGAL